MLYESYKKKYLFHKYSLNPYCNGICSMSMIYRYIRFSSDKVLILIVMEYAL